MEDILAGPPEDAEQVGLAIELEHVEVLRIAALWIEASEGSCQAACHAYHHLAQPCGVRIRLDRHDLVVRFNLQNAACVLFFAYPVALVDAQGWL